MTSVTLAPFLAYPLHPATWSRPRGSIDYRVTNTFDGPDYLNGGQHRAVDVGNFRRGDAVKSPIRGRGRGLRHSDGALGVRFDLGSGVTLELWHLDSVLLLPDRWTPLALGQIVGSTGATGARLPNGQAMPAHTHIAAARDGVPFDPEPHLPMPERPAKPIVLEEDDVQLWGRNPEHIQNRQTRTTVDSAFRRQARRRDASGSDTGIGTLPAGKLFFPILRVQGESIGRAADAADWYYGVVTRDFSGNVIGAVHSSVLERTPDGRGVVLAPIEMADLNKLDAIRTAAAGARQAIEVIERTVA